MYVHRIKVFYIRTLGFMPICCSSSEEAHNNWSVSQLCLVATLSWFGAYSCKCDSLLQKNIKKKKKSMATFYSFAFPFPSKQTIAPSHTQQLKTCDSVKYPNCNQCAKAASESPKKGKKERVENVQILSLSDRTIWYFLKFNLSYLVALSL